MEHVLWPSQGQADNPVWICVFSPGLLTQHVETFMSLQSWKHSPTFAFVILSVPRIHLTFSLYVWILYKYSMHFYVVEQICWSVTRRIWVAVMPTCDLPIFMRVVPVALNLIHNLLTCLAVIPIFGYLKWNNAFFALSDYVLSELFCQSLCHDLLWSVRLEIVRYWPPNPRRTDFSYNKTAYRLRKDNKPSISIYVQVWNSVRYLICMLQQT